MTMAYSPLLNNFLDAANHHIEANETAAKQLMAAGDWQSRAEQRARTTRLIAEAVMEILASKDDK